MDNAQLFALASAAVLPGWLALATAPLWRTGAVRTARIVAAVLAGLYVSLLAAGLAGEAPPQGASFTSLEGVRLLMTSEAALLAGWVHYLAFDLWVGSWEAEDARLPHVLLLPCLALTFLAGPTGLLLYLLLRMLRRA
ncbi:MAG: ABA4-like family protein [Polymorphobacter sp.]|uniref:ABA4-like family protein n=1 Tax=Polymorphobacter sp. TaxID=1909290 RepID=UPI003A89317E